MDVPQGTDQRCRGPTLPGSWRTVHLGRSPTAPTDTEALTVEAVGEGLGLDQDTVIDSRVRRAKRAPARSDAAP